MKKMFVLFFAMCVGFSVMASGDQWLTDMGKAMKLAEKTGKPILVDFSGSDWCGWCMKLDREVFAKKAFKEFAKKELILVLLDFPNRKFMTAEQKKHNQKWAKKYKVRGYPTVLLLDAKGKVLLRTGYEAGGPANYIKMLKAKFPTKKVTKAAKAKK